MWIHLARTAQATTSLLTALGSWQVLYCRRGKPGEADFLDNDLSRDILITHRHISRVLNTVRDALPAPSTAVRYEERERERERSHIVTFLYNVCTVFLGTLLDTGILGSVWVTPLGTERSGENAHNLNSRTTQTATRAHLASRDLGEEGTRAVTMRRKGGRAVGQARAAAVAQLFPSQDSRPLELRALPLLSRLGQPHQRQHPLPSQAPLDPPISLLHLWLFPSSPAPVQLRICDPAEKIVAGRKAEVGKRPTPAWHTQGNRVLLKTQAKNLAVPSWSPFSRMQTRDTGSLLLEVSLTWPWQLRAARKNSLFLWFRWKPRGGGGGKGHSPVRRNGQKRPVRGFIRNLPWKALEKGPTGSQYKAVPHVCSAECVRAPGPRLKAPTCAHWKLQKWAQAAEILCKHGKKHC